MKMNTHRLIKLFVVVVVGLSFSAAAAAPVFVGRLTATLTRGGQTQTFIYTAGTNTLRIERGETDWPYARNLVALDTGAVTLVFPHNQSFIRLPAASENAAPRSLPAMPAATAPVAMPAPANIGPTNLPGMPALPATMPAAGMGAGMPAMPMMPMPGMEKLELTATGDQTNLLGYACEKFELRQRGEVMEIWATDKLLPFQAWLANQPHRFSPRMIDEQWPELLKARKLFPLRASLRLENGPERLSFAVKSITAEKIEDRDGTLFQPPPDYHEIEPLPF